MATSQRDMLIKILGDSKGLSAAAKEAISSLDETSGSAEQVAAAIRAMADVTEAKFREQQAAVDALATAMGDELVADIQRAGGSVDQLVVDLERGGVEFGTIRDKADLFAASIQYSSDKAKALGDDMKAGAAEAEGALDRLKGSADTASVGVDKVRDSGDQSRSVLANMVGNSTQDLASLGGVAGTAGMALGQFGEYATEGNISMQGLIKTAGPMVLITAAVMGATKALGAMKQGAEDVKRQTEMLVGVQGQLADGQYEAAARGLAEEYKGTIFMLQKYGLGVQDLIAHMKGERDIRDELEGKIRATEEGMTAENLQIGAINRNLGEAKEAWSKASAEVEFMTGATGDLTAALTPADQATQDTKDSVDDLKEATMDLTDETSEAARVAEVYEDAARNAATATDEAEASTRKLDEALLSLYGQLDEEDAWAGYAEKMWDYHADTDISEQDTRDYIRSLADLTTELENVPEETKARIIAALEDGNVAEAEAILNQIARERIVSMVIQTKLPAQDRDRLQGQGVQGFGTGGPSAFRFGQGFGQDGQRAAPQPAPPQQVVNVTIQRVDVLGAIDEQTSRKIGEGIQKVMRGEM